VVFFLPLGIDVVIVILSAREPDLFWVYALLATTGSMAGAMATYWLGRKVGEHGIARFVPRATLRRAQSRIGRSAAYTIAALGAIPPPFPFTAFLLTSGACRLNPWSFFPALALVRFARFLAEGGLAAYYGGGILAWMRSPLFTGIVVALSVLAIVGTIVSGIAVYRAARRPAAP